MSNSILFTGGIIVDGLSNPARKGDVLVIGDRIAAVTLPSAAPAADRVVTIDGMVIAPGFIDMHTHSDLQVLVNPDHTSKLSQGVTTEVLGQDGLSYAPVGEETLRELRAQLKGWNDDPPGRGLLSSSASTPPVRKRSYHRWKVARGIPSRSSVMTARL